MSDEHENPFDIDPDRLDREWLSQPGRARNAGYAEADARHAHAQAKAGFDVVVARLRLAIRKTPGAYDLRDKPTVDEIDAAILVQGEYRDAINALNQAKYELDIASADTTAYVDRRKALESLVDLAGMDYHTSKPPAARTEEGRTRSPKRPQDDGIDFDPPESDDIL